jgi:hypothetical protein
LRFVNMTDTSNVVDAEAPVPLADAEIHMSYATLAVSGFD